MRNRSSNKGKGGYKHQLVRLPCPNPKCKGGRVIDAGLHTNSELHVMFAGDTWPADYVIKCKDCKAQIGIRKIS